MLVYCEYMDNIIIVKVETTLFFHYNGDGQVLGEALPSQVDIHIPWGSAVPKLAEAAHQAATDRVTTEALSRADLHSTDLDAVAEVGKDTKIIEYLNRISFLPVCLWNWETVF